MVHFPPVVTVEMQQSIKMIVQQLNVSHDVPFSKVLLIIHTSMLVMIDANANAKPPSTSFNWRTEFINDDSTILHLHSRGRRRDTERKADAFNFLFRGPESGVTDGVDACLLVVFLPVHQSWNSLTLRMWRG